MVTGDTGYKPISAYGIIGDMRSAALVGTDGSIDWCCFPRFDSATLLVRCWTEHAVVGSA